MRTLVLEIQRSSFQRFVKLKKQISPMILNNVYARLRRTSYNR